MSKLFVYGTLKRNHGAHHLLRRYNPTFLGEVKTHSRYHLYNQGWFPGMIKDESNDGGVVGELFEVPESCLKATDTYESVDSGLFSRETIELEDGTSAIAYLICNPSKHAKRVDSGIWGENGTTEEDS